MTWNKPCSAGVAETLGAGLSRAPRLTCLSLCRPEPVQLGRELRGQLRADELVPRALPHAAGEERHRECGSGPVWVPRAAQPPFSSVVSEEGPAWPWRHLLVWTWGQEGDLGLALLPLFRVLMLCKHWAGASDPCSPAPGLQGGGASPRAGASQQNRGPPEPVPRVCLVASVSAARTRLLSMEGASPARSPGLGDRREGGAPGC